MLTTASSACCSPEHLDVSKVEARAGGRFTDMAIMDGIDGTGGKDITKALVKLGKIAAKGTGSAIARSGVPLAVVLLIPRVRLRPLAWISRGGSNSKKN